MYHLHPLTLVAAWSSFPGILSRISPSIIFKLSFKQVCLFTTWHGGSRRGREAGNKGTFCENCGRGHETEDEESGGQGRGRKGSMKLILLSPPRSEYISVDLSNIWSSKRDHFFTAFSDTEIQRARYSLRTAYGQIVIHSILARPSLPLKASSQALSHAAFFVQVVYIWI